jgi:hypothetical protein
VNQPVPSVVSPPRLRGRPGLEAATALIVVLGAALRFLYLDADPHYYQWVGYITDEGRWVHHARSAFLSGHIDRDPVYDLHLLLAPLYQALNYLTFEIVGLSRWSSRIWTALFGSVLLVVFWRSMRPLVTPRALLVGVLLLAVQVDFVALSRISVPEMVIVCFQALVFFTLMSPKRAAWQMIIPGVLLVVGITMKATLAMYVAIFVAIVLFVPAAGALAQTRWRNLRWFLSGLAATLAIATIGLLVVAGGSAWKPGSTGVIRTLLGFVAPARLYDIIEVPFDDPVSPVLNYLALGIWISWVAVVNGGAGRLPEAHRRYLVASSVWIASYFVVMVVLAYFPQRYRVHIILPMAINVTFGFSLLEIFARDGFVLPRAASPLTEAARTIVFTFPSAALLAPLLAFAARVGGADVRSLRVPIVSIAVASAAVGLIAWRRRSSRGMHAFLVVFPVTAAGVWALCSALAHSSFWPAGDNPSADAVWMTMLLASTMAGVAWAIASGERGPSVRGLMHAYVGSFVVMSLVRLAPSYLWPQYTIRDTSRELGAVLREAGVVASSRAEGLFTDNTLVYERFDALTERRPDAVVVAFRTYPAEQEVLDREYELVKMYPLHAPTEYYLLHRNALQPAALLYKRRLAPLAVPGR